MQAVKGIRPANRRLYGAEEKIRIVLEGLRAKEGIAQSMYYNWSGRRQRLEGSKELRREASALKECVADLTLENRLLKKASSRTGETTNEISC